MHSSFSSFVLRGSKIKNISMGQRDGSAVKIKIIFKDIPAHK